MALPKWITPAGQLGIVPELDYYEFPLDAYDASGGTLVYSLVSGRLPLGLQIVPTGRIQGIPVSEPIGDQNNTYRFTVRVRNSISGGLSDRTFSITIANISPPIISNPEKDSDLGVYLDGTEVTLQLEAIENLPGATLIWSLVGGELPPGLSISPEGLIFGYIEAIPDPAPGTDPGWDQSPWNLLGWDFPVKAINKNFRFTVQVTDGLNYDRSNYTLEVYPRSALTADNDTLTADSDSLESSIDLTINYGPKHNPIITTVQSELVPVRQDTWFSFNVDAIDLDGDIIYYSVPGALAGAFDEQELLGDSITYIASRYTSTDNGLRLAAGMYPKAPATITGLEDGISFSVRDFVNVNLLPGDEVKVVTPLNIWREASITNSSTIQVSGPDRLTANIGDYISQAVSGANANIKEISDTVGTIELEGNLITGIIETILPSYDLYLSGNIVANVGQYITQVGSTANAVVTSTFMSITLGGANADRQSFSVGDYITQDGSTGNARVTNHTGNVANVFVTPISGTFNTTSSGGNILVNGNILAANTKPISTEFSSSLITILYNNTGPFTFGSGNIRLDNVTQPVFPIVAVKDINNILLDAEIGDIITQAGSSGNATVTATINDDIRLRVRYSNINFNTFAGNILINGSDAGVTMFSRSLQGNPFGFTAEEGEFITQPSTGANARVTRTVYNSKQFPVEFITGSFDVGSGNVNIGGATVTAFPDRVTYQNNIVVDYYTPSFDVDLIGETAVVSINGVDTQNRVSDIVDVGIDLGVISVEGTVGFDESKFDQGTLALPPGVAIDRESGWITGQLPGQTVNQVEYQFEVVAFKRDDDTYKDAQLYTITVLGDLNNRIEWITPSDLGTIENGEISDLSVFAVHTYPVDPKTIFYKLKTNGTHRLPQGLVLTTTGLIVGRISFNAFSLDKGIVSLDNGQTTFDNTYTFTITAQDLDVTVSADRTFTIRVINSNIQPYENLYLKALPSIEQRQQFAAITQDSAIFPTSLIYRTDDPNFGIASTIKTLFVAGLNPTTLEDYVEAAAINHFKKRIIFGGVKTAVALDEDFNVKYEVVYLDIKDENTNEFGQGPADVVQLAGQIENPFYDLAGNSYTTAYPNAFSNMQSRMVDQIGYANKGILPDWMTSRQPDGRVLGFTRAVVLAYVQPGASELIAYQLNKRNLNLNQIDFTVDRYQVDNSYTENYDIDQGVFLTSAETTFDRYPQATPFNVAGSVDYAITIPYEEINNRLKSFINEQYDGLDGIKNFRDGQRLVFAQQEFRRGQNDIGDYNQGWNDVSTIWDNDPWDYDNNLLDNPYEIRYGSLVVGWAPNTTIQIGYIVFYDAQYYRAERTYTTGSTFSTTTIVESIPVVALVSVPTPNLPDTTLALGWDAGTYIPGYNEHNLNPSIPDQRIGIWQINIDEDDIVSLTFVEEIEINDQLFVRNGFTYGATNIYYDPVVKEDNTIPNYSILPQQVNAQASLVPVFGTGAKTGQIVGVNVLSTGSGYVESPPPVIKFLGDGSGASAFARVVNGAIVGVTMLTNGTEYTTVTVTASVFTIFDGNGTRFFDYRDEYTIPESNDKYIKFTKTGVFT
jgi:hypothetical protein